MKYIPWYIKIVIKLVLSRLPFSYSFWQKIGLFRHGHMDKIEYTLKVFHRHLKFSNIKTSDLKGKLLIEIGPGDSIVSAMIASSFEAKMILIDVGHFVKEDVQFYINVASELINLGYNVPDISHCKTIYEILNKINSKYYTEGVKSFSKIKDSSVDLIFSQAVLEHVRVKDFNNLAIEIKRVLKLNALSSHAVDLKDHLSYSLNNLRFSDRIWETEFFASSGFYTNRMSISEIENVFLNLNLQTDIQNKISWNEVPISRNKMAKKFKDRAEEFLLVSEFDIVIKKI